MGGYGMPPGSDLSRYPVAPPHVQGGPPTIMIPQNSTPQGPLTFAPYGQQQQPMQQQPMQQQPIQQQPMQQQFLPSLEMKALRGNLKHAMGSRASQKSSHPPNHRNRPSTNLHRRSHSESDIVMSPLPKPVYEMPKPTTILEDFHALLGSFKRERAKLKRTKSKSASSTPAACNTPKSTPGTPLSGCNPLPGGVWAGALPPSMSSEASPKSESGKPEVEPVKSEKSILDDFMEEAAKKWSLHTLSGQLEAFAKDQLGSRFLQSILETAPEEEYQAAARELAPHAPSLMVHSFGNYVMQRLLDRSHPEQLKRLVQAVLQYDMVLQLSCDAYGCRVMQKMLSLCHEEQRNQVVAVLKAQDVSSLILDPNANHVIHRVVELLPKENATFISEYFEGKAVQLSRHKYASRVLLQVIRHGTEAHVRPIISELLTDIPDLAYDQFGNYTVQHILEYGSEAEKRAVMRALVGSFTRMSMQKYASNVVEKSLRFGTQEEREWIISEIIDGSSFTLDDEMGEGDVAQSLQGVAVSPLIAIMVHPYGNYVVQRMIEYGSSTQQERIVSRVNLIEAGLEKGKFGKHILGALKESLSQQTEELHQLDASTSFMAEGVLLAPAPVMPTSA